MIKTGLMIAPGADHPEISGHIYRLSPMTTIHALGEVTDALWFVNGILKGLAA